MNSKNIVWFVIFVGVIVLGTCAYTVKSSMRRDDVIDDMVKKTSSDSMTGKMIGEKGMVENKTAYMDGKTTTTEKMMPKDAVTEKKLGSYISYDSSKIASAAKNGNPVLFFHAGWCPTCRAANEDIVKNISSIPANLTIFKTDYDSSTELKKRYGVTKQHTFVQVDENGNKIKSWTGSSSLSEIVSNLN